MSGDSGAFLRLNTKEDEKWWGIRSKIWTERNIIRGGRGGHWLVKTGQE